MKVEFSRHTFEKYSDTKFHKTPFIGSQIVQCGRTDGREADCRFSQFCERA